MKQINLNAFRHSRAHCYVQDISSHFGIGDFIGHPMESRVFVFENGKVLNFPHEPIPMIERDGNGRFCHWDGRLYFSTSDNSDPSNNGRTYTAAISDELYFSERYAYWARQVSGILRELQLSPHQLKGKRILEIGPGKDMGLALIAAGLGATVVGVEKYKPGWNRAWHSPFIDIICQEAAKKFPFFDAGALRSCQAGDGFDPKYMSFHQSAMEELSAGQLGGFDITFSCAVLEHVADPDTVTRNLFELTKPNGRGLHYIDLRDHRNFARPLEYLLLDEKGLESEIQKNGGWQYCFGNPMRRSGWLGSWRRAGFTQVQHDVYDAAGEAYLENFVPRLRSSLSPFKEADHGDLQATGVVFRVARR